MEEAKEDIQISADFFLIYKSKIICKRLVVSANTTLTKESALKKICMYAGVNLIPATNTKHWMAMMYYRFYLLPDAPWSYGAISLLC